ncbi:biopolymer transporter ExbD [Pelagicoccus sp. SDUM812003]|uniref:ExbD/TolR family protein n=1 Tax=Pelagicoccus sp. SDUM812003 TaxID=3041267 RepID=UPI00280D7800|nr:biopolymer transporter ExbD [Pelagicoccus sp. SDUM812003]MDQ8203465.1 biopolymer transporter ExbD [Pelagicoccus sp. SDUM812003]
MSRAREKYDSDEKVDINLSPMIDCIFILLIFFIVTTVFVEESGIEVNKPQAASTQALDKNSILIAISADDRVYYGGEEIGVSGVRPRIQRILTTEESGVIIQADSGTSHGAFARVYGEAKAAGAKNIHFATKQ